MMMMKFADDGRRPLPRLTLAAGQPRRTQHAPHTRHATLHVYAAGTGWLLAAGLLDVWLVTLARARPAEERATGLVAGVITGHRSPVTHARQCPLAHSVVRYAAIA
jgi:hypothetical protein